MGNIEKGAFHPKLQTESEWEKEREKGAFHPKLQTESEWEKEREDIRQGLHRKYGVTDRKPVQRPGIRGGKYWMDDKGIVRYGSKSEGHTAEVVTEFTAGIGGEFVRKIGDYREAVNKVYKMRIDMINTLEEMNARRKAGATPTGQGGKE